eukprot:3905381-Amphidinium_carterae.1
MLKDEHLLSLLKTHTTLMLRRQWPKEHHHIGNLCGQFRIVPDRDHPWLWHERMVLVMSHTI